MSPETVSPGPAASLTDCPFEIVDVFAERPLAGNPLAVVRVESMPPPELRQAFARETNLSETTFVATAPDASGHWPVKIHTPDYELPFAGHPTLGTAWVVRERLVGGATTDEIVLALGVGPVRVHFEGAGAGALGWLDAPTVTLQAPPSPAEVAALLAIDHAVIDPDLLPTTLADTGPRFLIVGLRNRVALAALRPDAQALSAFALEKDGTGILAVAPAGPGEGDFATRMFFETGGLREDPATGSAACCLAAVLRTMGRRGTLVLTQGVEMQRPSRIRMQIEADLTRVGGRVFPVLAGTLGVLDEGGDAP